MVATFSVGVDRCDQYTVFPDAIGFVKQVTRLNNAVLGIRWTTCKRDDELTGAYDKTHTDKMFNMLQTAEVDKIERQTINFFIRGHYANRSRENLMDLYEKLNRTNTVTFTLYSDEQYQTDDLGIPLNMTEMRDAIQFFGPENVYLQVSDEIRSELNLNRLSNPRDSINGVASLAEVELLTLIMFVVLHFFLL